MSTTGTKTLTGVKIVTLTRLNNSVNGNPRWLVLFDDGTEAQTQSDAAVGYGIGNAEYRDTPLTVTLTRAGRITHIDAG